MKPVLFSLILALLLFTQQLPTYAQKKPRQRKTTAPARSSITPTSQPLDLGDPGYVCGLPIAEISSSLDTYLCVERMPVPPGGVTAFIEALDNQVHQPVGPNQLEGRVWATFVVTPTGQLTDFKIWKSLSPEYDAEALRVLQLQPPWTPGYQNGQAVRVQILSYVSFRPEK